MSASHTRPLADEHTDVLRAIARLGDADYGRAIAAERELERRGEWVYPTDDDSLMPSTFQQYAYPIGRSHAITVLAEALRELTGRPWESCCILAEEHFDRMGF